MAIKMFSLSILFVFASIIINANGHFLKQLLHNMHEKHHSNHAHHSIFAYNGPGRFPPMGPLPQFGPEYGPYGPSPFGIPPHHNAPHKNCLNQPCYFPYPNNGKS